MKQVEERYISLLTDFGFKRIFGSAPNKDLLICFLNSLFNGRQVVKDVKFLNPENVGDIYTDRKAIFDVYCEGENGEKFIVEMQNAYQTYFKDRACSIPPSQFVSRLLRVMNGTLNSTISTQLPCSISI